MPSAFEEASHARAAAMLDVCTRCGRCVEACPVTGPGAVHGEPAAVITGVVNLLRDGTGSEPARRWASSCALTGECIAACPEGLNPRFLLAMARVAIAREHAEPKLQRQHGVEDFRKVARDVQVLSRLQLTGEMLDRLGQLTTVRPDGDVRIDRKRPDFVFYTGCNLLKTPHIALLALDVMDALGVSYRVMGGPSHCCGIVQFRTGDLEASGRMAENALERLAQGNTGQVLSWCASCHVQFTEVTLPARERSTGARPFEMTPFMLFLRSRLDDLRPLLRERVEMRVALHRHPGVAGVMDAAADILAAVPGIELVDLHQPSVGLMSNYLRAVPDYQRKLQRDELEAARTAGVDAVVAVYHPDHRELCAHERNYSFLILNLLDIVGASMGLWREDRYKRLKKLQDVELILAETQDMLAVNGVAADDARRSIRAMLADQPLALRNVMES